MHSAERMAYLTGKCPVSPALEGGVKGRDTKGGYLTGKPRPLGCGAPVVKEPERKKPKKAAPKEAPKAEAMPKEEVPKEETPQATKPAEGKPESPSEG